MAVLHDALPQSLPLRMYNGGIGGDCVSHMVYRFDSDIKIKNADLSDLFFRDE